MKWALSLRRKHASRLRLVALGLGGILPCLLVIMDGGSAMGVGLALLLHMQAWFVERWLFFAEAKHTVRHLLRPSALSRILASRNITAITDIKTDLGPVFFMAICLSAAGDFLLVPIRLCPFD
jgi:hypothetical protein